ncbi:MULTISPECIES: hypothetical protein [unclassified Coleofasciculus]|uniref:hypothetical protein n=1 Tax=unclassified Coleofasciculus TaxID=2692782 RepID=UPI001882E5A5|nr:MULTISPECIES: hypothetical protein [unclassified Coleofasciculus]MBE9127028.1 hypothetical protein [Coleofasciculus sp. LEGE 07081]MBE9149135.1 hypothetical protein [Coleofasciculus sp. LEGE 07092]
MNKLIGLIIVVSALVGAATAWRFPFSLGQNQSSNQVEPMTEGTEGEQVGQAQVQPANQSAGGQTTQVQPANQPTAQAPQTTSPADTGTTQPPPSAASEPVTALW